MSNTLEHMRAIEDIIDGLTYANNGIDNTAVDNIIEYAKSVLESYHDVLPCANCKEDIHLEEWTFCPYCGHLLSRDLAPTICPECRSEEVEIAEFLLRVALVGNINRDAKIVSMNTSDSEYADLDYIRDITVPPVLFHCLHCRHYWPLPEDWTLDT